MVKYSRVLSSGLKNPIMNGPNNSLFSVPFASVALARERSEAREIKMKGRKQRQTIVSGEPWGKWCRRWSRCDHMEVCWGPFGFLCCDSGDPSWESSSEMWEQEAWVPSWLHLRDLVAFWNLILSLKLEFYLLQETFPNKPTWFILSL